MNELDEKNKMTDKKLSEVDQTAQAAQNTLHDMERTSDFATILLAAQNDNWTAFDQLRKLSEDKSFPLSEVAANAYVKIRVTYASPIEPGYLNINWRPGTDPLKLSYSDFMNVYAKLNPMFHAHLVNVVWSRPDILKKEKMEFLAQVLEKSNSLTAKDYAAKFFIQGADDKDLKWQPFNIDVLLAWWNTHKNDIK